jgi:hypothetical protein
MKNYSLNLNQKNAKMPTDKLPSLKVDKTSYIMPKTKSIMPKVQNKGRGLGKY